MKSPILTSPTKPVLAAGLLLAGLALACGSSPRATETSSGSAGPALSAAEGPPVVIGTVIDAATGEPLPGVEILGPDGSSTRSGADGRFALKGMARGTSGRLLATAGDGREGAVTLRPLAGGSPLEIVLRVR